MGMVSALEVYKIIPENMIRSDSYIMYVVVLWYTLQWNYFINDTYPNSFIYINFLSQNRQKGMNIAEKGNVLKPF